MVEWLEEIASLTGNLPEGDSRRAAMIQWLSDRQDESLPPDERQQTLRHLVSFGRLPEGVLQKLIPQLVHQAQYSPDELTREVIVESLLALYKANSPLNQDLWIDLNDYRRLLLNGDENQKRYGSRLDRLMREIRKGVR